MSKAMIVTVGAQGDQIIFSVKKNQPEFIGFLTTNTEASEKTVEKVICNCDLFPTKCKMFCCEDKPSEIGKLVHNFNEIYNWLTKEKKVLPDEIEVDPTGGRKWMSSGTTMIASFLGLKMSYIDVGYKNGQPDPDTMKLVTLGNAYEQTGFLEEHKADKLFNENMFVSAISIYELLSIKLTDPRKILIKKDIADGYLNWTQFRFEQAYQSLSEGVRKIEQYQILIEYKGCLKNQIEKLEILKKNDEQENNKPKYNYFLLLKDDKFSKTVLFHLYSLQLRFAENDQYEQAVIILYRILEFIGQYKLAKYDIDTDKINEQTRNKYDGDFRKITGKVFGAERGISNKIALVESWVLLCCINDSFFPRNESNIIGSKLRAKTEPRNLLWIEHGNKSVSQEKYTDFKNYVDSWLIKIFSEYNEETKDFSFIKFKQ